MQYKREVPERSVRNLIIILEKEGHVEKGSISRSTLSHNLLALGYSTRQLREFYLNHRVPILEDCFRKAMLKFGKPDAIYVDNAKEYISRWMRIGCARLGIRHITAKPYSPESKGKIERFNEYADEFMREAALVKFKSLAHLNQVYRAWLEEGYQHKEHAGIGGQTPMECFQNNEKRISWVTAEECYNAFLHEETRMVDKTGCFSLQGVTYEAGTAFMRKKVDVRFDPFDLTVV